MAMEAPEVVFAEASQKNTARTLAYIDAQHNTKILSQLQTCVHHAKGELESEPVELDIART